MRRCLLILPLLLLLTAPAVADAGSLASVRLSSTPEGLTAGRPWRLELAIRQPGRAPRTDLRPAVVVRDADGNRTTYRAHPTPRPGHYAATVRFPRAGQWTYFVYDGLDPEDPHTYPAVVIRPANAAVTTTTRHPDPVGPPALPIVLAGVIALGAGVVWLARRRRHPPARLA